MKKLKVLFMLIVFSALFVLNTKIVSEAAELKGAKERFKVNMQNVEKKFKVHRMQEFHIIGNDLYMTQRFANNKDEKENDVAIIKFTIANNVASYTAGNYMIVENSGHGETLDAYTYGKKTYFLIGSKGKDDEDHNYYSHQIGRVEYKKGTTIKYTSVRRLTGFDFANQNAVNNGQVQRVAACSSADIIWFITFLGKKNANNKYQDCIQISAYALGKVNEAFDDKSTLYTTFEKNESLKGACKSTKLIWRKAGVNELPNDSFQGMEAFNASVCFAGGTEGSSYPEIWCLTGGTWDSKRTLKSYVNLDNKVVSTKNTEIEGLCIKGGELYFGIVNSMSNIHIVSVPLVNISEWATVAPM